MLPEDLGVSALEVGGEVKLGHAPRQRLARHHDAVGQLGRAHKVLLPRDLVRRIERPLPQHVQDKLRAAPTFSLQQTSEALSAEELD